MPIKFNSTFIILIWLINVSICGCTYSQDCNKILDNFNSYEDAIEYIESTHFTFSDVIKTTKSSWIEEGRYYSCDGEVGYFIAIINSRKYIHKDLPRKIWKDFKNAESFGKYYNSYIKGRYQLNI